MTSPTQHRPLLADPPFPGGLPIGARWVDPRRTETVRFPYDGSPVAEAPVGSTEHAAAAMRAAAAVAGEVAELPSRVRRDVLARTRGALAERRADVERLLVLETGKPLVDCRVEVERTLVTLEAAAEEVARLHGETVPLDLLPSGDGMFGFWVRRPVGVVVGIAGFNYPLLLAAHKIAPAIAAGCPVVCKPAPQAPLATLWLVHLVREAAARAGAPAAAVQLVTGDADVGSALVTDPGAAAVSFTGSAAVGHAIARAAAPRKTLLELGSNAALCVAPDADLDAAVAAVVKGGFYASGQACISVQRVLVTEPVAEEFLDRLLAAVGEVAVGDPREEGTRVSALIDERSTERVLEWVRAAAAAGARVAAGGGRVGTAVAPTVLTGVPDGVAAWDEEVFGPVVCVRTVPDVEAAFDAVNASRYGLHASVFTRSMATAFAAVRRLEVGGVVVNEVPGFRSDTMPYGGVKDSGIGREGPRFAVEELTVTRMAVIRPE
ncbi:acyl-CoA reductase-like NAD-dependent aldehyde dehydrogenase [Spinactinospora alkalitolerans]|uniref:Acyl-CoA reductase-like NAD-dependent aldehyde dehydrogenase n=1 Tax=Spinactinospora alkalitolerans TaxID=687207 RepID=A0A852TTZ0_9ACTN|nr:aldehyde dehydrogenase family protein [Spinactinospora alkalitolerans]NYE46935.1 acyl-CoA reductase-like NAD-dependent aldehyde dehydrogenase [Spinactinospora alkalitolerans]